MNENRNHIRIQTPDVTIICKRASDDRRIKTICKDISLGGVRIPETFTSGEGMFLDVIFPPYNRAYPIEGKVAWCQPKNTGVQFTNTSRETLGAINKYIALYRADKKENFLLLLKLFSHQNKKYINEVFYTALKVLYFAKYALKKPILEPKAILYVLDLVKDYIYKYKPVEVKDKLLELMKGKPVTEGEAFDYWDKNIPRQTVDRYGRIVKLGDAVFDSLHKDPYTGKKIKAPGNYKESRAKRLPWLIYTLRNTNQIYESNEKDWIIYYYTMPYVIKYRDKITEEQKTGVDHYLVVTKQKKGVPIQFVTAYTPGSRLELFKKICRSRPYNPLSDKDRKFKQKA